MTTFCAKSKLCPVHSYHFPVRVYTRLFQEILDKKETRKCVRRNYLPFLKYLESCEPGLANYTSFLAKLDKRLFRIFHALQESGLERILTLCHGDSKPDNFMFRKIEIDIEDMECEGTTDQVFNAFLNSIENIFQFCKKYFLNFLYVQDWRVS